MQTYSFHNHTHRCKHASGTDRDYLDAALAAGYERFGFSDHTPLPGDAAPECRMSVSEIDDYCASLTALREECRGRMALSIGFETEYYPALFDDLIALYRRYPIDYLILGQHGIGAAPGEGWINSFEPHAEPALLTQYVDQSIAAIATGRFSCFAHPDVFQFIGDPDFYRQECNRLMQAVKSANIPLEINLLGLSSGRHYPNPAFWQVASRYAPKVVFGRDAHSPSRVNLPGEYDAALRFADRFGLEPMEKPFPLIDPRF